MKAPKVNELNIDEMLTKAETLVGVLRVVYGLQNIEDYTKKDAAEELIKFLDRMGYLEDPLRTEGVDHA
ncbi:hypothetical protein [Virgibacillus sp. DJP39]|uniref:hypothetical protein n=1 Tax=Virgibacillus sp. DJP39 TaxID=3409790 RepID=UPI003BB75899